MKLMNVLRAMAATEYFLLRLPITAVDQRVIQRLPADTPLRRAFERSIGGLDVLAGKLTGDVALVGRGTVQARRPQGHEVAAGASTDAAPVDEDLNLARRAAAGRDEAARIDAMMANRPTTTARAATLRQRQAELRALRDGQGQHSNGTAPTPSHR